MKIAPIIHSRTYHCDFNSKFLVRPKTFMESDIQWARKNVLGSTMEIDGLQGLRLLVAKNDKFRLIGVTGFLKDICSKCTLSDGEIGESKELFYDDKGRSIYAFIGIVIENEQNSNYGSIPINYLWRMYLDEMIPIWSHTYQDTILRNFYDYTFEPSSTLNVLEPIIVGSMRLYESNEELDYRMFNFFSSCNDWNTFSFCSNIMDYNAVKQSDFSDITTSYNIITRLQRTNNTVSNTQSTYNDYKTVDNEEDEIGDIDSKKKKFKSIEDWINDISTNYSDVFIDAEDGFGGQHWTVSIRKCDRDYRAETRRSGVHEYRLIIKRSKNI